MEIGLTIDASPASSGDVIVTASPSATIAEVLAAALGPDAARPIASVWVSRLGISVSVSETIARSQLRNGDRLQLDQGVAHDAVPPSAAKLRVRVDAGPDAGKRVSLSDGVFYVGRDPAQVQIALADTSVSSVHCELRVHGDSVVVSDMGSRNGTILEGVPLAGPTAVQPGQLLEIGTSLLTVSRHTPTPSATNWRDGRVELAPRPRTPVQLEAASARLPAVPRAPTKRRIPLASAIVPVVLGIAMFAFFKQPYMLLMIAGGPIMVIWSTLEDRSGQRKQQAVETERFITALTQLEEHAATAHAGEVAARRLAAPAGAEMVELAAELSTDLWGRRPSHGDFLNLRLGMATQPSYLRVEVDAAPDSDPDLLRRAEAVSARNLTCWQVPVELPLAEVGVAGICGAAPVTDAVVRSLLVQAAAQHSPRDLAIVVLVAPDQVDKWSWTKWLPHTEVLAERDWDRTVAGSREQVMSLFETVRGVVSARQLGDAPGAERRVLVVVGDGLPLGRAALSDLLSAGPEVGVLAVCVAQADHQLPAECRVEARIGEQYQSDMASGRTNVLAGDLAVRDVATGARIDNALADRLSAADAAGTARILAGLRDVTDAGRAGTIPAAVDLVDLVGMPVVDAGAVAARWSGAQPGLGATVGVTEGGPLEIDIRRDGPHGLVAGTTGAGKSELLQTFVASLAVTHPPWRVNFVLVDYKGGAAFKTCTALPHTVGFVTDLDQHLTRRALVSLNAELRRREHLLAHYGAKDVVTMERMHPREAPPNLLIVVDEFATLVKDVPEFVRGVVDVAQRGRSLGVHLVLATQRPGGVVDENVRANTNLRIALRVNDPTESNDVVGIAAAARLAQGLAGRGYVRLGAADIREFQTAYVGGTHSGDDPAVRARRFGTGARVAAATTEADEDAEKARTDLDDLVAAACDAYAGTGLDPMPQPWLPQLPDSLPLDHLPAADHGGFAPVVGLVDLPQAQRQDVWALDFDALGNVLVFGSGGSGKTTFLRTVAAALSRRFPPTALNLYALDFASRGLGALTALPHCGGVVFGDELERSERLFVMLENIIAERRVTLGSTGSASLSEYRDRGGDLPYVVVMVDGFSALTAAYEKIDYGDTIERFARIVSDGRAVGVHFLISVERRGAVPGALFSVVPGRVVLRLADADDYFALGLRGLESSALPPGRAFTESAAEVQVAHLGGDPSGEEQVRALGELGAGLRHHHGDAAVPQVRLLPARVGFEEMPAAPGPGIVWLGLSGTSMAPMAVDVGQHPVILVAGPSGSGKTAALATITRGLMAASPGAEAYLFAPRRSTLADQAAWTEVARGLDACDDLAGRLVDVVEKRRLESESSAELPEPLLVVVDDGDEIGDACASALEQVLRRGRDVGVVLVLAGIPHVLLRAYGGLFNEVKRASCAVLLQPGEVSFDLIQARAPRRIPTGLPPGRAHVIVRGQSDVVQVAI